MTQAVDNPAAAVPVSTIAAATLEKAHRDGLFWRLRPGQVVAPNAAGQPRVLFDGDTVPVRVVSMVGPLPEGARVQVVLSPPAGNHVVGFQGVPPVGVRTVAYWRRSTNHTGITAEVGHVRLDGIPIEAGHLYRLRLSGVSFNNVTTRLIMRIRGSTTGTATTGSTVLAAAVHALVAAGTTGGTRDVTAFLLAAATGTLSAIGTLAADSSVDTINAGTESPNDFVVEDLGDIGTAVVTDGVNL